MRWGIVVLVAACGRVGFGLPPEPGPSDGSGSTIDITIVGFGAVVGPNGFACADHCTLATTQPVTLQAIAGQAWQLDSFGPPCDAATSCTLQPGAAITVTFVRLPITANRVFVTSTQVTTDVGLAGLDSACMTRAFAVGLQGHFIAFASTSTMNARDRLAGYRGWVRMDGLPFIDQSSDLGSIRLPRGVMFDEATAVSPDFEAATGSNETGTYFSGRSCADWTTAAMAQLVEGLLTRQGGSSATGRLSTSCGHTEVVCFQIDSATAVTLVAPPFPAGRYVFVSSSAFGFAGISGADAQCQAEAAAAGLPGNYRAILPTTSESASDRIGGFGGVWRRVDGQVVAEAGLDGILDTMIALDDMHASPVYFGVSSPTALGTTTSTCGDWTDPTITANESTIDPSSLILFPPPVSGSACSQAYHLICAQLAP